MFSSRKNRAAREKFARRGSITILAAVLMVVMVIVVAFAVDIGMVSQERNDMQRAADASALAAVLELSVNSDQVATVGRDYARINKLNGASLSDSQIEVTSGNWNSSTRSFTPGGSELNAVKVLITQANNPFFFGTLMAPSGYFTQASATATFQPRDLMLVLDYSGSMNDEGKITSLKSAVSAFLDTILETSQGKDRVGFVRYSTTATLEQSLTTNIENVRSAATNGNADGWTDIGDGLNFAINELSTNGRSGAKKVLLLLTDGLANRPEGVDPIAYVQSEAVRAASLQYPIFAVSFGSDADQTLMSEVAATSRGQHFHVNTGVFTQSAELIEVFRTIAKNRSLRLVD